MSNRDNFLIAVGLLGRPRHDSIDACGSLNIEYQKALTIRAGPIFVTWGEPSVPQIATPSRMAAGTEDVSADVVLTEIKTRVGSGNFRVDAQTKDWAGRVVADCVSMFPTQTNPRSNDRRLLHVSARQGARTRNFWMSSKCRTLSQVGRATCGTDTLRPAGWGQ